MIRRLCVLAALIAVAPRPAAAQEPGLELSGGAAIVRDSKNAVKLLGWYAEGVAKIRPNVSIVVEGSQTYREQVFYAGDFEVGRQFFKINSVMAGARLHVARIWRLREYAQILAGRLSGSGSDADPNATSHITVQPGIGLDFPLASRLAFRIELDARYISTDGRGNQNGVQFRFTSGFAYALKK
jgi:hypothetical protein